MRMDLWHLEFTRIARTVRTRQRLMFLVAGALLVIIGVALRNITALISGMLVVGSFAYDAMPGSWSPTAAHVRMWQWLDKSRANRRR
jgi:thiamine transporter ThiT